MGAHIVSDNSWGIPATQAEIFDILKQKDVIDNELCNTMKNMAGFRNLVVNEYQGIDFAKVYKFLQENLEDFTVFVKRICEYAKI